jgi:3-hydroxyisobutyrate dehydrogenase-like beta-hydroxyacid dehydrogenase
MRRKPRKTAGVIGLGIIGSRVAAGLRAAGYQTYVWSRTARPTPNFLASPADVADSAEIVQIFVSDGPALMQVLEALTPRLTAQHIIVSSSTVGPEAALEAAKFVEDRGALFLDAPFTGSKVAAERGQLVYYVGGDENVFLRARPILEATSKQIVRAGGIGDAALLKVVTNQIAAVSIQAVAEALAIVRKAGLPPEALSAVLEHNGCRSGTMDLKLPKMISGDFEPHFSLKHMFKDVQLGSHLANALDIDTPTTAVTAGVLYCAMKRGWGELDFAAISKLYEEPAAEPVPALAGSGTAESSERAEDAGEAGDSKPEAGVVGKAAGESPEGTPPDGMLDSVSSGASALA